MQKSLECITKAILGETGATQKYSRFAEIALKEGYANIAYLFQALVFAERIHIKNHKNAVKKMDFEKPEENFPVGTTLENVKAAIAGETYEFTEMYPGFIKEIKPEIKTKEGKVVKLSFEWAEAVEKTHAEVLSLALQSLQNGKDIELEEIYVCRVCGNLILGAPTEVCPVCKHDKRFYKLIDRGEN